MGDLPKVDGLPAPGAAPGPYNDEGELEEVVLARRHAAKAELEYSKGSPEQVVMVEAAMATMYLAIAARKESK